MNNKTNIVWNQLKSVTLKNYIKHENKNIIVLSNKQKLLEQKTKPILLESERSSNFKLYNTHESTKNCGTNYIIII